jgi:hypothetical protein
MEVPIDPVLLADASAISQQRDSAQATIVVAPGLSFSPVIANGQIVTTREAFKERL